MKIDHIIVHVDDKSTFDDVKEEVKKNGLTLESLSAKGSRALRLANVWFADSNFDMSKLIKPEGVRWVPAWTAKKNRLERGDYCLNFRVDSVEKLQSELSVRGIRSSVERTEYTSFFGINTSYVPWYGLRLPMIPGTKIELCFFETTEASLKKIHENSSKLVSEFSDVEVLLPQFDEAVKFLSAVFPKLEVEKDSKEKPVGATLPFESSSVKFAPSNDESFQVIVEGQPLDPKVASGEVQLQNLKLRTSRSS